MPEDAQDNWFSNDTATFGDRVAAARDARAMTQKALAQRLGVALKTIEKWENDISEPRANKLSMLSGVLNVSMRWLLTGEGEGVDPEDASDELPQLNQLMAEMRTLRVEMLRSAERLGVLEKRLKQTLNTGQ